MAFIKKNARILIPIASIGLSFILFTQVFMLAFVPTESMVPTIKKGALIVGIRHVSDIEVGDVVIFRHEGQNLVKRVHANKGKTLMHDGKWITVPDDCFYMRGDNSDNSYDSRYWDDPFVKKEDIIAKVIIPSCKKTD